ncbi:MAG: NTP transferase domain-containing protein [Candidatus Omnitrophica bacterium]|nr:NTP transferase domain-containing protein [Candidatus Omnitrophota bacterium]
MTKIKNLYGLILAGGFSKRMGQDKALLNYHGKPQIQHVHDLLESNCEKVFLSKRSDQSTYTNLISIDDDPGLLGIGPLGGILSAMKAYPEAAWLIMACDLPFITQEAVQELISCRSTHKMATAFKSIYNGLPEPLCAIWESTAYSKVLEFKDKGVYCPRQILINSDVCLIEQRNSRWLDNVNDLKEFKEAIDFFKN